MRYRGNECISDPGFERVKKKHGQTVFIARGDFQQVLHPRRDSRRSEVRAQQRSLNPESSSIRRDP
jgi:hypothetical protein